MPLLQADDIEVPSIEAAFLARVQEAIEAQMGETGFGVDALAAEVGMSPRQLLRKLKALTDERPNALLRRLDRLTWRTKWNVTSGLDCCYSGFLLKLQFIAAMQTSSPCC